MGDGGTPRTIAIVGAPIEVGASEPGAAMGPAALRTAGLAETLRDLGHMVEDRGDIRPGEQAAEQSLISGRANNAAAVAAWAQGLHVQAHALMQEGLLPLFLGGDHAMAMGTISGIARHCHDIGRPLFVLWLDAHVDFNTPETTPSGNMHGMPVAMLVGQPGLEAVLGPLPRVPLDPGRFTLFGIRSIDAREREAVAASGLQVVDMRRIDEEGVVAPLRQVLEAVHAADGMLHLSFDIDFLDPMIAPAVGTTVAGGATYREAHLIMEMLYDSGLVTSVEVAELNPFLDVRGASARLLVELLASLFGRRIIVRPR